MARSYSASSSSACRGSDATRALDLRRPGARLSGNLLTTPLAGDTALRFALDEPHELAFGWFEAVTKSTGGPTTNTRGLVTYAILSQAGRGLFLQAEDSVRDAQSAGWPNKTSSTTPDLRVRLWATDRPRDARRGRALVARPPGRIYYSLWLK